MRTHIFYFLFGKALKVRENQAQHFLFYLFYFRVGFVTTVSCFTIFMGCLVVSVFYLHKACLFIDFFLAPHGIWNGSGLGWFGLDLLR